MLNITRSAESQSSSDRPPVTSQPDFIPLARDGSEPFYTIDRAGDRVVHEPATSECPAHIDDMMSIVRTLRQRRLESMSAAGELAALDPGNRNNPTPPPLRHHHEPTTLDDMMIDDDPPGRVDEHSKNRRGNFTFRNMSDVFDLE
jgi:hypothetical protein